jgi:hypothetical protein
VYGLPQCAVKMAMPENWKTIGKKCYCQRAGQWWFKNEYIIIQSSTFLFDWANYYLLPVPSYAVRSSESYPENCFGHSGGETDNSRVNTGPQNGLAAVSTNQGPVRVTFSFQFRSSNSLTPPWREPWRRRTAVCSRIQAIHFRDRGCRSKYLSYPR